MTVLCELAQQRPSIDVITHLLWCLANHKMSCSASMVTAHVSITLAIMCAHVRSHDPGQGPSNDGNTAHNDSQTLLVCC